MSNGNHKPDSRPATKKSQQRQIKVCQQSRDYRPKHLSPYAANPSVPWIQLKGKWLEKAGFAIDTLIKVRVMNGCLVLTAQAQKPE
ncbi:SymE family type I addiction module toxin [Porticoccus sp.]